MPRTRMTRSKKKKGFQSDEQRKAVMAILKQGKWSVKVKPRTRRAGTASDPLDDFMSVEIHNTNMPKATEQALKFTKESYRRTKDKGRKRILGARFDTLKQRLSGKGEYEDTFVGSIQLHNTGKTKHGNYPGFDFDEDDPEDPLDEYSYYLGDIWDDINLDDVNIREALKNAKAHGIEVPTLRLEKPGRAKARRELALEFVRQSVDEIHGSDDPEDLEHLATLFRPNTRSRNQLNNNARHFINSFRNYHIGGRPLRRNSDYDKSKVYLRTHTYGLDDDGMFDWLKGNRIGSALYILGARQAKRQGFAGIYSPEGAASLSAKKVWDSVRSQQEGGINYLDSIRPHAKRRGDKKRKQRKKS